MRLKLIDVGGIRALELPEDVLSSCKPGDEIEVDVQGDRMVLQEKRKPREGWELAFEEMHRNGDDQILDEADAHSDILEP